MKLILALVTLAAATPSPLAFSGYLFDAVQIRAPFRPAWDRLMKDVQPTPDWLREFDHNFDGVSGAMTPVTIDNKPYFVSFVCKPTDCAGKRFIVLFTGEATKALGALGGKDLPPAFFGAPTPAEQEALIKGF